MVSSGKQSMKTSRSPRVISMRVILSVTTVTLISASLISFGWLAEGNTRSALSLEMETRLVLEARNLASLSVDALLTEYPELTLCPLVSDVQTGRPDLAFVVVLDHENRIRGHLDLDQLNAQFGVIDELTEQAGRPDGPGLRTGEKILGNRELLVAAVPAQHANGRIVGTALVGLKQAYLDEIVTRPRQSFFVLTFGLLFAGIAVTLLMMSHFLKPIETLRLGLERIGRGDLETDIRVKTRSELGQLARNVNGMARQLKESQAEMLEKERLDHEMDLASQIQQSLLPEEALRTGDFECLGANRAAAEVGGDFYDYFPLANGRIGLVVADVSGKGLGGCLVTSMLAVLLRSLRDQYQSPKELLIALEKEMQSSLARGTFITIFYGILDPTDGTLTFASAAHSPLFVYRSDGRRVDEYKTKGIPLGAMKNGVLGKTLEDYTIELAAGDLILQYTDGLNESWNPERQEQFGYERVKELILRNVGRGNQALLDSLVKAAEQWARPAAIEDDLTLLALVRCPAAVPAGGPELVDSLAHAAHLALPSEMDHLAQIRPWLEKDPVLGGLASELKMIVESSLYEVCANVIEHGYGNQPGREVDLWWVPNDGGVRKTLSLFPDLGTEITETKDGGYFLVRDGGEPMRPDSWTPPDLDNPECRRKGRGLGLQIVHSSMKTVEQIPGTPSGNLTLLRFDPQQHLSDKETHNV
jgi:serine phosphatase RsbU (regulator of sigma subunit)/anti-sigma regulatory factor (Ser/Thr protein kinase)